VSYVVDFEEHVAPEDYAELTAWLCAQEEKVTKYTVPRAGE
jgi:hypothetical protein